MALSNEENLSRRDFLWLALTTATAAALAACQRKSHETPIPTIPVPKDIGEYYSDVTNYYPELSQLPLFDHGMFASDQTVNSWYNFSSVNFDPEPAAGAYTFFESLSKTDAVLNYRLSDGAKLFFAFHPRTRRDRIIFIIPENAPLPAWRESTGSSNAATTGRVDQNLYISFVRVIQDQKKMPPSQIFFTPVAVAADFLFTEACQAAMNIHSQDASSAILGQELTCNSLAYALAARSIRTSASNYQKIGLQTFIGPNPNTKYPLIVFGEDFYNQLPILIPFK